MSFTEHGRPASGAFDPLGTRSDGPAAARAKANARFLGLSGLAAFAVTSALYARSYRSLTAQVRELQAEPARDGDGSVPEAGAKPTSEGRYELLAHHTRDIVYFTDAHDRIVEANAAAERAYGYLPNEMVGLDAGTLQATDTLEAAKKAVARARGHETVVLDTLHRRKNGTPFPVELTLTSSSPGPDGGELLAIVRDTTEHQLADEALTEAYEGAVEASRLKAEFVAAMGHEIRTPMNTIMGMSELMLDGELSDEQRGFSEAVRQAGRSLLRIIDDVLDFTQLENGGPEFELEDVDVATTIEAVVAEFASRAAAAGLSLTMRLDAKVDVTVRADDIRLRQILTRLIDNALKFTEQGTVVVSLGCEAQDEWSTTLRFAVEDSGPGISDEVSQSIFEPFQQADRSSTRKHAGAGLGLAIACRLIELMGGSLSLDTVLGEGSTFWFSARFDRGESGTKTETSSVGGARVLVVDDDPMAREIVDRYVRSWGMESSAAATGTEALERLRAAVAAETPFDVAIIDYSMPGGMGGLELGMRIKGAPELAGTQLILVTAYKDLQQRQAVSAAGFTSFLAKPVDRAQLLECVAKAVRRARARSAVHATQGGHGGSGDRAKRILLVEDNPINQQLGVRQIKKLGFDAVAASNGEQALAALEAAPYDLVFMDCQMPTMDGFAATRALRASEERSGRHVIVVAMTANALVEDRRKCLAAGMDDYLAKPVQLDDLQRMIQRWIWDGAVAV